MAVVAKTRSQLSDLKRPSELRAKLGNFGTLDNVELKDLVFSRATIDSYTAVTGLFQLHGSTTKATLLSTM